TKPFHTNKLITKLKILIHQNNNIHSKQITLKNHIKINPKIQIIYNKYTNKKIILTKKQHQILMYFLHHPNQVLPKKQ
ncbi:DNA-binding response regulator, partial [Lysinibacillus agricola]